MTDIVISRILTQVSHNRRYLVQTSDLVPSASLTFKRKAKKKLLLGRGCQISFVMEQLKTSYYYLGAHFHLAFLNNSKIKTDFSSTYVKT